ncbi:MAG: 50S ribosomal protein L29 [Pseudomonadota bacterium]
MKAAELRDKTPDQLRDLVAQLKKEKFNLRFREATAQVENTSEMRKARRTLAKVLTILNEKARAEKAETAEAAG